tara:strand:+ start:57 stop:311 length:255 start_codon:yes stop_codon:yes gene_type:complete
MIVTFEFEKDSELFHYEKCISSAEDVFFKDFPVIIEIEDWNKDLYRVSVRLNPDFLCIKQRVWDFSKIDKQDPLRQLNKKYILN